MKKLGLIGRNIAYSFSEKYFNDKFREENIAGYSYQIFDLKAIKELNSFKKDTDLLGFNVTIPYKKEILPFLDVLSDSAKEIGAVNTVLIKENKWIGYNTDAVGFRDSLLGFAPISQIKKAYILGTGGASLAVEYVLRSLDVDYQKVSRVKKENTLTYTEFCALDLSGKNLIINTTPLGTFPNIEERPAIDYSKIHADIFAYDLVYNPIETAFMLACKQNEAKVMNGLEMLHGQADEAWAIWTDISKTAL